MKEKKYACVVMCDTGISYYICLLYTSKALPFNGKMESDEKIANQDAFMNDQVHIIVATSAFRCV